MSQATVRENAQRSIADLLRGIRVVIVAPSLAITGGQSVQANLLVSHFRREGASVDFLPINPVPWGPLKHLTQVKYVRTLIVSLFYVISLLRCVRNYDVVHIFAASYLSFIIAPTPAILISRLFRKRVILNYRSGEAADHLRRWGRSVFWILRCVDKIIVPSAYLADVFARFGFEANQVQNIADGFAFRFRVRGKPVPHILVARCLEPLYDIETALRAFALVKRVYPQATITITGSGSDEFRSMQLVKELQIEDVTFTGRVERDEMPELFARADIFLNTSIIDNMPVSIIEALHCGVPVVTTNAGGIPYMIEHRRNGLLVEKGDYQGAAEAVIELCRDNGLRREIVAGGWVSAQEYCWDSVKWQWGKHYAELVRHDEEVGKGN